MSEEAEMTTEEETQPAEEKLLTATQLFSKYMTVRGKVQKMTAALGEEVSSMGALGDELAARFGIYVSGSKPQAPTVRRPNMMPSSGPLMNEADGDGEKPAFKPPVQYHADAPALSSAGSEEVAEIRRGAGLSEAAADSEELASSGRGMMEQLHKSLPGTPSVVATPGEHHDKAAAQERSNAEGGPVTQKPTEE